MTKKFPDAPASPERICWGCDKYCSADSLACGNGSDRTQHPIELFGKGWRGWGLDSPAAPDNDAAVDDPAASALPLSAK